MKTKNIFLSVFASLLLLSSCNKFLSESSNPNKLNPNVFWKSEADINKGMTSAYAYLQPSSRWASTYERFIITDGYRSDEITLGPAPGEADYGRMGNFNYNETTWYASAQEWYELYKGVSFANQCVDNIPNVEISDELKNMYLAEARFLRAYYYYRLLINFGERIPLHKHAITGKEEELYPQQAQDGEVIAFLEQELSDIQQYLPEPEYWKALSKDGRANKYAAAGLLAKFYLFLGNYDKAEIELKKIIDSGKFSLLADFANLWDCHHKNSSESIFEIQFTGDISGGRKEYNLLTMHFIPNTVGGYQESLASDWIFETLKNDVDDTNKPGVRLYSSIFFNDPIFETNDFKPFFIADGSATLAKIFSEGSQTFINKYTAWDATLSTDFTKSAHNIQVIRYADVLLLYAECLNNKSDVNAAIDYINIVRKRAKVKELPNDGSLSQQDILKHLQDVERPCELAFEGHRWYDLVRWGIVKQALTDHGKTSATNFVEGKHELLAIPHDEFLLNSSWVQNPGYSK